MRYISPIIHEVQIDYLSHNQGSGVVPLNPECSGNTSCSNLNTFIGTFCSTLQTDVVYDVHYFVPSLNCATLGETPCTVKVNGNVLSCTEESTCADGVSCNNQQGSIIRCSGTIPNLNSCDGLDATVECTGSADSDACSFAI